jgi:signal transduction histidine kinase
MNDVTSTPEDGTGAARRLERKQSRSAGKPAKPPKWHYLYFVLAALDLIAVSAGLYLSHSIMSIYVHSVEANQTWAERVYAYSNLGELAAAVNAPGNDVFDSRDVGLESERMQSAKTVFDAKFAALRAELTTNLGPSEAVPLLARLDAVGHAMEAMLAEARLIFSYFRAGHPDRAGERMATMDRRYAVLNSALAELRHSVAHVQQKNFEHQTALAARQQQYEYIIGGLILLMVAGATFYGHRMARQIQSDFAEKERLLRIAEGQGRLRKRSSELKRSNTRLHAEIQQRLLALKTLNETNQQLKAVFKTTLDSQEAERREIARELHEDVAQLLGALKMRLSALEVSPSLREVVEPQVKDAGSIAASAITRVQSLVRDLTPHGMDSIGLVGVLRVHLEEWTQGSGLEIRFSENLEGARAPSRIESAAYRIAKEAVSNVVRHARAATLEVELLQAKGYLHMHIVDDGVGFDTGSARRQGAGEPTGLALMEQRVTVLGGKFELNSASGRGTAVKASFPIYAEAAV